MAAISGSTGGWDDALAVSSVLGWAEAARAPGCGSSGLLGVGPCSCQKVAGSSAKPKGSAPGSSATRFSDDERDRRPESECQLGARRGCPTLTPRLSSDSHRRSSSLLSCSRAPIISSASRGFSESKTTLNSEASPLPMLALLRDTVWCSPSFVWSSLVGALAVVFVYISVATAASVAVATAAVAVAAGAAVSA